ncbi:MAG: hypothetical protein R3D58_13560 [Saprospiraceae bacterium]
MVKLWDRKTGMSFGSLASYEFWANAMFSPQGNYILSYGGKIAYLSDARTGNLIRELNGHSCTAIVAAAFSPDEKWAATAGDNLENEIRIWDVAGKEPPKVLGPAVLGLSAIHALCFTADGRRLIVAGNAGTLLLVDWNNGKVRSWSYLHNGRINTMALSHNGQMLLTGADDGIAVLWNLGDRLDVRDTLQSLGYSDELRIVSHVEFSPDDRYFLFGSIRSMAVFDIENRTRLNTWSGSMDTRYAAFNPDGKTIISSDLKFFDIYSGKLVRQLNFRGRMLERPMGYLPEISQDGKYIGMPRSDGFADCYEMATGRLMVSIGGKYNALEFCEVSRSGHLLLMGERLGSVKLGNLQTGQFHILPVRQYFSPQFSPDEKWVLTGKALESGTTNNFRSNYNLALWNTLTVQPERILNSDRYYIKFAGFTNNNLVYGVPLNATFMFVWDLNNPGARYKVDLLSENVVFDPNTNVLLSADKAHLGFYSFTDKKTRKIARPAALAGNPVGFSKTGKYILFDSYTHLQLYELSAGNILSVEREPPIINFDFHEEDKNVVVSNGKQFFLWDIHSGNKKYVKSQASISNCIRMTADGAITLTFGWDNIIRAWNTETGDSLYELHGHRGEVNDARLVDNGAKLITASRDGLCFIWDLKTRKAICKILAGSESDYLIVVDDQYFMGNPSASKISGWKAGGRIFSFEQFDLKYNRPDVVLQRLGYAPKSIIETYNQAYKTRLDQMDFTEAMLSETFHAPEISILSSNIPETTGEKSISVRIQARDAMVDLDCIHVTVNGVPAYGSRGIQLRKYKTRSIDTTITIPLMYSAVLKGDNRIQISVRNQQSIESYRETFSVARLPANSRPKRYVIVMGTNSFEYASDKKLDYAENDAGDIAKLFQSAHADFDTTIEYRLLSRDFTKEKVLALKDILLKTQADDHVYLFCSTHGFRNVQAHFYLATYETDFQYPETTALPYEELERLLDSIPAMNKLLFLDACFAGEIDAESLKRIKAENTFQTGDLTFRSFDKSVPIANPASQNSIDLVKELFIELRLGTGATVIAAAGGGQFAREGHGWSNGLCTYVLLEGLKNRKADLNKDGVVLISELQQYLSGEVSALTNGWQKPVFRIENISNDFKIW